MDLNYKRATTDEELRQILTIQQRNIKSDLPITEVQKEGFITVHHDFDILKKMNEACPHIIAKDGDKVAGYALVMLREFKNDIAILQPMFAIADELLLNKNYVAVGQICIDKPYRKMGLFKGMYQFYREELHTQFDCLFTEVATDNQRSLQAHLSVGFTILRTQLTDGVSWELINWDWKTRAFP